MIRIKGTEIPGNKRIVIALTFIYGISTTTSVHICDKLKINHDTKAQDLQEAQLVKIRQEVNNYKVEGDLRREKALNIKRLMEIGCYRGMRHRRHLPVRGQSTKQNARTCKGPRKTVANKKK